MAVGNVGADCRLQVLWTKILDYFFYTFLYLQGAATLSRNPNSETRLSFPLGRIRGPLLLWLGKLARTTVPYCHLIPAYERYPFDPCRIHS